MPTVRTDAILDIDMREVQQLQRELRAVSKDFANAMQRELRAPVAKATSDFKFAARTLMPAHAKSDAASTIRTTSSNRSGYTIRREDNERFTQDAYSNRTGRIRHPLYGNRDHWFDTYVPGLGGWWDKTYDKVVPRASDEFTQVMLKILDRLASGNISTSSYLGGGRPTATIGTYGPQLPGG